MKYYCPECKTEYFIGEKLTAGYCTTEEDDGEVCGEILIKLPDFETPSQYEKRTGKKWNGAVWCRPLVGVDPDKFGNWMALEESHYKFKNQPRTYRHKLCAASPEPPPDDYVPEVEA